MRSRLFLLWLIHKVVHYRKLPVVSYTYPNRSMRYAWGCMSMSMSMICNITADIRTYTAHTAKITYFRTNSTTDGPAN